MKYALLVHQSQEYFDRRDNAAAMAAAGRAYGEALQAAGVLVGGAGLQPPQTATTVSVRDGKRQVHDGPYAETKEIRRPLRTACEKARGNLQNRELVIDLKNLTAISQQGEDLLFELINERVKFRCGVFTKHVLRQLARRKQETVRRRK